MKKFVALIFALLMPLCFLFGCGQDKYSEGFLDGHTAGKNDGYSAGYSDGKEDGYSEGKNKGYSDGKEEGYSEGYEKAKEDSLPDVSLYPYSYGSPTTLIYYSYTILEYGNSTNYIAGVSISIMPTRFLPNDFIIECYGVHSVTGETVLFHTYSSEKTEHKIIFKKNIEYTLTYEIPKYTNLERVNAIRIKLINI